MSDNYQQDFLGFRPVLDYASVGGSLIYDLKFSADSISLIFFPTWQPIE